MKVLGFNFGKHKKGLPDFKHTPEAPLATTMANVPSSAYGPIYSWSFDGEKNLGEIGPARDYKPNYEMLRARSWQANLDSEIAKTVIKKYALWVVGSGLKLQCEPMKLVLKSEGFGDDIQKFANITESRFHLYASSKASDYAGMQTLNQIENTAFINAIVGGDVLVILRHINNVVKVQLIDGANLCSPGFSNQTLSNGNTICNGIEISSTGEHVAFHIRKKGAAFATERIEAKGKKSGKTMAYMVYGDKYRIDDHRGIPIIVTVLETLAKLERYKEATVGAAEETAKIVYQIVHEQFSTGESPLQQQIAKAMNVDAQPGQLPVDVAGNQLADKVAATTNKMAYNNPPGAEIKSLKSEKELYFKDFYITLAKVVCATVGIPYGVAFSDYDGSYSASRAEIMDWKHISGAARKNFAIQFLNPIYSLWLDTEILKNKISAPGYNPVLNDSIINQAYQSARWTGPDVPHIDPLKEVKAVREKLGAAGAALPLTTLESAIEELNGGDSEEILSQFAEELKESIKLKVVSTLNNASGDKKENDKEDE
jgi:capsid protein